MVASLEEALKGLLMGLRLLGDSISYLFRYILEQGLGVQVPDSLIKIATILIAAVMIWKFSSVMGKVVLYALIFLLVSSLIGLLPIGSLLPGL